MTVAGMFVFEVGLGQDHIHVYLMRHFNNANKHVSMYFANKMGPSIHTRPLNQQHSYFEAVHNSW